MELFVLLTAWADFLSGQLAVAEIDERASEAALDELEALALIRSHREDKAEREARLQEEADTERAVAEMADGDKEGAPKPRRRAAPTGQLATVLKAYRDLDPAVVEQKQEHANRYAYRKLITVLFTNVERNAALVSRELTRRTASLEAKPRRETRWRA